jgi:hypothetical protein
MCSYYENIRHGMFSCKKIYDFSPEYFKFVFGVYTFDNTKYWWLINPSIRKCNISDKKCLKYYKCDSQNNTESYRLSNKNLTNNRVELMCSGIVNNSCSINGTRRVTFVTNPVISSERGKDRIVIATNGIYSWSQIFRNG